MQKSEEYKINQLQKHEETKLRKGNNYRHIIEGAY